MPGLEESTRTAGAQATLHRDWEIWGPNGGYLSAVALRAAGAAAPAGHRPVTYSCQYLSSPPSGEIEVSVTPAKVGRKRRLLQCGAQPRRPHGPTGAGLDH